MLRRLAATVLVLAGFWLLRKAIHSGNPGMAFGCALIAICGLWMPAVGLTLPDSLPLVNRLVSKLFTFVYMPEDRLPPLDYSFARRMAKRAQYNVAVREYLKIFEYYPKEFDAYCELIRIAVACQDTSFAREVFQRALKFLPTQKRKALRTEFEALFREP